MTDFAQPPQEPQMAAPQLTPNTLADVATGALTRFETDKALEADDMPAYARGMDAQRMQAGMASVEVGLRGGNPLHETAPIGQFVDPQVEMERRFIELARKTRALDETLEAGGMGDIQQFLREVADQYRAQNGEPAIKKPKDEQEWQAQVRQNQPVMVDPNRVAEMRQRAVKLDQAMKAVDPSFSFWTHPKTRAAAQWLNREAGGGQVGFFTSGDQPLKMGAVGTAAMAGVELAEGFSDFGLNLIHGTWDLADQAVQALGGDSIGPLTPTNYVMGPNGEMIPNGGKVPGIFDGLNMLAAAATGQNIEEAAAEMNRTRELELASRNGFQTIVLGASRVVGMGFGFGVPAGAAMKGGAQLFKGLNTKGLHWLGTLGMKGAESERALKITRFMAGGLGAAVGNGVAEGVAYGRAEGYASAFMHGMAMAPVLMTLGAMGKRTEWFLHNRAKMPKRLAEQVGAAMEGVGFGAMEAGTLPFMPAAWDFIQNPNEETWETYAKNIAGFMMFKAMTRGRSVNPGTAALDMAGVQATRGKARAQFAEKVARGEASEAEIREASELMGGEVGAAELQRLGELSMAIRQEPDPKRREQLTRERNALEQDLDIAEFGLEPSAAREARAIEPDGVGEPDLMERTERRIRQTESEIAGKSPEEIAAWGRENFREGSKLREQEVEQTVARRAAKARETAADPLEDPRFMDLPEATREAILAAPDVQARRDIMLRDAPERRKSQMGLPEGVTSDRRVRPAESRTTADDPVLRELREAYSEELRARPELESFLTDYVQAAREMAARPDLRKLVAERNRSQPKDRAEWETFREQMGLSKEDVELVKRFSELGTRAAGEDLPDLAMGFTKFSEELRLRDLSSLGAKASERTGPRRRETPEGERRGPQSFQVPPTRQKQADPDVQPVRDSDIYREMSGRRGTPGIRIPFTEKRIGGKAGDVVQVPMVSGNLSPRVAEGLFMMFENLARTREGRDLVVASHEWSHAMHKHTQKQGGLRLWRAIHQQGAEAIRQNPEILREIRQTLKDYPGSDRMNLATLWAETWAEWHARNLLGEVGLDQRLPHLSRYMRAWLAEPAQAQLRDQYGRIQSMLDRYNRQGSYMRERMSIEMAADAPSETTLAHEPGRLRRMAEAANVALFDDMARLKDSQKRWLEATGRDPSQVDIMDDPARLFDALRMTAEKTAEHYVRHGIREPGGRHIEGLESIFKKLEGKEEQFIVYLSAVRNAQLWKRGKQSKLPIGDHLENIRTLQRDNPEFRIQARKLKQWTDGLIDYVARSGNLDLETAQRIKDSYVVYIPFFRSIEGPRAHAQARGVAEGGTGLKRIKGSTYNIRDPIVALQKMATQMIAKSHQNIVMSAVYRLSAGYEAGGIATVVDKKNVPMEHPVRRILDALERNVKLEGDEQQVFETVMDYLRDVDGLDAQTITLFTQKTIPVGERNIIAFTPRMTMAEIDRVALDPAHKKFLAAQQGKLQWLEIQDPRVYEALMGIDQMPHIPPALQPFMNLLKGPRDLVRFFATGVAPGFVAANLVRDALSYPIFTQDGKFRPFGGFVKLVQGAIEYHKNGEMRQLYEEMGVKTSSFFTEGEKAKVAGIPIHGSAMRKSYEGLKHWAQRAQDFFAHPENYLRMAEFKGAYEKAKAQGASETKARMVALEAGREITVNFARAGIFSRVANQAIPYFNAGLQGKRKLWRQLAFGGDGQNDAQRARIQRAAFLNGMANITMPTLALWLMNRDEEWYQDLPEWRKSMFWNMRIGDTIMSMPKPFEAGAIFGSVPEAFVESVFDERGNPISFKQAAMDVLGAYTEGMGSLIPAAFKPLLEVSWNWNSFAGRPLTPEWIKRGAVPEEQSTFYTTETAKILSQAVNGVLNPIEIEHMLSGYTAGAAVSAARAFEDLVGMKDHPVAVNPLGRFFKQRPHGSSRYVDQLYELSDELSGMESKLSPNEKRFQSRVETAKRQLSDLRAAYREGRIEQVEAEERSYQLARPLIEEWNQ